MKTILRKPIQSGDVFGDWTVVDPEPQRRAVSRQRRVLCRCACNADVLVLVDTLRGGRSTRCLLSTLRKVCPR